MNRLRVINGACGEIATRVGGDWSILFETEELRVQGSNPLFRWTDDEGSTFLLYGSILGVRQGSGILSTCTGLESVRSYLENAEQVARVEGRYLLLKVTGKGDCEFWTDRYARMDLYWQSLADATVASLDLEALPFSVSGAAADNVGLAHALTIYGSRPAKRHTLYKGVERLGIDCNLRLSGGKPEVLHRAFVPVPTGQYTERDRNRYADILLEAVRSRASCDGNVVYLSSGWDSTSILGCLVHLFGNTKTRAVIGRMRYSDRSGIINQFELDRAKSVCDYYGVRLDVVELDYRQGAVELFQEVRPLFRSQQFANLSGLNQWRLAKGAAATSAGKDETVFHGEMSDGAHNLGFSQFATIFHAASQDFREYSDKMMSYLYGPTFLQQVFGNKHSEDPIWNLFKNRVAGATFDAPAEGKTGLIRQMLSTFFLRQARMPFYSMANTRMLTQTGQRAYLEESERVYLEPTDTSISPETWYAWILHLYNSFHWQGGTVLTLDYTTEWHGLRCAAPYHDSELINFLSAMPESWGRGLDLKPTKYPLKWTLENRIDYPLHLQVGPHSYTYDVIPDFSLMGEILYASSLRDVFCSTLSEGSFLDWLESSFFDMDYIGGIVKAYQSGDVLTGQERSDILSLAMQASVGVFSS